MSTFDVAGSYEREAFENFLDEFLPEDFKPGEEQVFFRSSIMNGDNSFMLGVCDSLDLAVYELNQIKDSDPRVTITKETVKLMKNFCPKNNVLAVFYNKDSNQWRFSLITSDVSVSDNGRVRQKFSNPHRYSFLLGDGCKRHTPESMLFDGGHAKTVRDLEDLKSRFAIETVSDNFFHEYKVFYEDFVQFITGNRYIKKSDGKYVKERIHDSNKTIFPAFIKAANSVEADAQKLVRDYIKKMMGRLVFLQFMQKKGWLGVEVNDDTWTTGDKNFTYNLFQNASDAEKKDFMASVLEPMFFGMLNTPKEDRKRKFREEGWNIFLLDRFKKIPYLNGGLFAKDILDDIKIKFPKEMFCNPEKEEIERTFIGKDENYDYKASCGLLDFFNLYNFTIDESDPADVEVGVDPEMLGKIFENLLEDNKDKGAFYTPKEIVNYMCKESLISYLCTESKGLISEADLRLFVETQKIPESWTDEEKKSVTNYLETVKICDPAVGSGAFPMGLLNLLFNCRHALNEDEKFSRAEIKMHIVQNSIYGVDIEKGAVDIARLRFWLSIMVDADRPEPLPNLDYKIMQGNSLIESYKGIDLSKLTKKDNSSQPGLVSFDDDDNIRNLTDALKGYFFPENVEAKEKIQKQIEINIETLLNSRLVPKNIIEELTGKDRKIYGNTEFFLWHTWFSDVFNRPSKEGFDIVIGNPPY
ncbi:MAG: hypothetical protein WCR31_07465, partial [Treponema sp.]